MESLLIPLMFYENVFLLHLKEHLISYFNTKANQKEKSDFLVSTAKLRTSDCNVKDNAHPANTIIIDHPAGTSKESVKCNIIKSFRFSFCNRGL